MKGMRDKQARKIHDPVYNVNINNNIQGSNFNG